MKKLLVVLALGIFTACDNSTSSDSTKDSAIHAVDSAKSEQKQAVDSAANAQKNTIDSVKKLTNEQIDSEAAAKKNIIKEKDTTKRK